MKTKLDISENNKGKYKKSDVLFDFRMIFSFSFFPASFSFSHSLSLSIILLYTISKNLVGGNVGKSLCLVSVMLQRLPAVLSRIGIILASPLVRFPIALGCSHEFASLLCIPKYGLQNIWNFIIYQNFNYKKIYNIVI